ncbi:MAG TPA: hypothetical protein VKA92_00150 [Segetibacter sp.]|nr:hypothetical protein [Segetibacter sp.]
MTNFNQNEVLLNIQQLIDKSRCTVDGFFTDSKTAADEILKYLERENIINKNGPAVEINYNERSKAA